MLALLQRKQGATIASVMGVTGWQPHSVRGFLTAVVRKKLGLTLLSEKPGEERAFARHNPAYGVSDERRCTRRGVKVRNSRDYFG